MLGSVVQSFSSHISSSVASVSPIISIPLLPFRPSFLSQGSDAVRRERVRRSEELHGTFFILPFLSLGRLSPSASTKNQGTYREMARNIYSPGSASSEISGSPTLGSLARVLETSGKRRSWSHASMRASLTKPVGFANEAFESRLNVWALDLFTSY